jgi:hypothetical protein
MLAAIEKDIPFSINIYNEILQKTDPSPLITDLNKL